MQQKEPTQRAASFPGDQQESFCAFSESALPELHRLTQKYECEAGKMPHLEVNGRSPVDQTYCADTLDREWWD